MQNPVDIIKKDHKEVENLFFQFKESSGASDEERRDIADKILKELTIHAKMEEKFFYPKLAEITGEEKMVEDAIAEHHAAKVLILELKMMPVSADSFESKMKVLEDNIMKHVEEEEGELLPKAQEEIAPDEMDHLGKEMEEFKADAHKSLLDKLLGD